MIIKTRVCAGGGRSITRFPIPRLRMEECLKPDGRHLDISRAMLAFTGDPSVFQISGNDNDRTLWAALTFCELMTDVFTHCVERDDCDMSDHPITRQDEKIVQRIDKKCAWVRQSISTNTEGVTVKVAVNNPFELVGQTIEEAENVAASFVQMWLRIMDQTKVLKIRLETDALHLERAKEANRRADLARKYAECERRIAGNCSPCDFKCPLFRDGKCGYEEVSR